MKERYEEQTQQLQTKDEHISELHQLVAMEQRNLGEITQQLTQVAVMQISIGEREKEVKDTEDTGVLRLYDPLAKEWVLKPAEQAEDKARQEIQARQLAEARVNQAEAKAQQEAQARQQAEAELAQLRAELERLCSGTK